MLRFQGELPHLPVPTLEETCALYLRLLRPLSTEHELAATRRAVEEFLRPRAQGQVLQRRLVRWSESVAPDNWLEPFWDDCYLCDDTPLVVNVSPGFVLTGSSRSQVTRAAGLLGAALRFKRLVDEEQLEPDAANARPRCMSEYPRVLASTRVPGSTRDRLERHPASRHIIVVRGGRLYSLDVLDEDGRPYSVHDLERALARIADGTGVECIPVCVLTSDRRRVWAAARDEHLASGPPRTRAALAAVESSILLLVLERGSSPASPRSREAARLALHGDVRSRWFDKSIQLVIAENGVAAFCMEHAGFDGTTALRFAHFLVEHEADPVEGGTGRNGNLFATPVLIERTDPLVEAVERSRRAASALVEHTDIAVVDAVGLGKKALVAAGLSPDGFVQMAFQVAHFSLTGERASTYESVDMKHFLHGRTEAMRSVSEESVAFVSSLRGGMRATQSTTSLLRAAVARHADTVRRCKEGSGVDRHLLGLRRMLEEVEPVPVLFEDAGYARLSRSVLSTSSLPPAEGVELVCFGPVVEEGFGLSYTIADDSIRCIVTNFNGLAGGFTEELERALGEMQALYSG